MDINFINNEIKTNRIVVLYFSSKNCGVCKVIRPKLVEVLKKYPNLKYINIEEHNENIPILANYSVFTFPALLAFTEGSEGLRQARFIDLFEFEEYISRLYNILYKEK